MKPFHCVFLLNKQHVMASSGTNTQLRFGFRRDAAQRYIASHKNWRTDHCWVVARELVSFSLTIEILLTILKRFYLQKSRQTQLLMVDLIKEDRDIIPKWISFHWRRKNTFRSPLKDSQKGARLKIGKQKKVKQKIFYDLFWIFKLMLFQALISRRRCKFRLHWIWKYD